MKFKAIIDKKIVATVEVDSEYDIDNLIGYTVYGRVPNPDGGMPLPVSGKLTKVIEMISR